jgi:hypothetical protein
LRAAISSEAAQRFIDRASAFYAQAQKEIGEKARVRALPEAERLKLKPNGFGTPADYIRIQVVSDLGHHGYMDDFDDDGTALLEFADFIRNPKVDSK